MVTEKAEDMSEYEYRQEENKIMKGRSFTRKMRNQLEIDSWESLSQMPG